MTLTKADIVKRIYETEILDKPDAVRVFETFLEVMKRNLEQGNDVLISGFGKFNVREKRPRRGRNPHTGEDLMLDARRVVTFRPSGVLKKKINGGMG